MPASKSSWEDRGQSPIGQEAEPWKDCLLLEVLGTLDELNAHLGLVRSLGLAEAMERLLARIQEELLQLGAELAGRISGTHPAPIRLEQVAALHQEVEHWETNLPKIQNFIIPAGSPVACQLHVCRAVCRRAERRLVSLLRQWPPGAVSPLLQEYLNQLGKLLFVLARSANQQAGIQETTWKSPPTPEPD
ncbi:MAG: cob(I)yrinic acid a,c-diamide adenosyltransferase [Thermoguttaceae bacterium]|nr:cob(I)yrinic acid a,c-diamide adenosyltransferase [Thermoguttaceae bacterium]MDW8039722.1 cob(I)yrinic acid a,c-diamide adenosyltransferase [Thermoguttaceae bacterium]